MRDHNRGLLFRHIDPKTDKKARIRAQRVAATNTFKAIALEWYEEVHSSNVSKDHATRNLERLTKYVFPKLGDYPITAITPSDLLTVLRELEKKGILETASRVKNLCGQVFRYAIATERASRDISADLRGVLKTPKEKHHPAIIEPGEIGELLRAIEGYSGHPATCAALRLAPLLFVRPGELRQAQWKDFDLELAVWNYHPTKNGLPFVFPLPRQAVRILRELHCLTGEGQYVFPSVRSSKRPMSNNTLNGALHRLDFGGKMTPHGFRAMARTVLAEQLNFPPEYIEQQLGHSVRDSLGRAYNRTTYLEQRRSMLQTWADYLDSLVNPKANVVPLLRQKAAERK